MLKGTYLTTTEAAKRLGVSDRRVRALIAAGRMRVESLGGTFLIPEAELKKVAVRKSGRPKLFRKKDLRR